MIAGVERDLGHTILPVTPGDKLRVALDPDPTLCVVESNPTIPNPKVSAKATRRRFTAAEKARILDAYDGASAIEKAALCRRERIYSSPLSNWRKKRSSGKPSYNDAERNFAFTKK